MMNKGMGEKGNERAPSKNSWRLGDMKRKRNIIVTLIVITICLLNVRLGIRLDIFYGT